MVFFPILSHFKAIFIPKCPFSITFNSVKSSIQGIVARPSGQAKWPTLPALSQLCLNLGVEHDKPGNRVVISPGDFHTQGGITWPKAMKFPPV